MSDGVEIAAASDRDQADVMQLLEHHHLPLDGLFDHWGSTMVARQGDRLLGSVAIEIYADAGLLRSVAVADDAQGMGIGQDLTRAAIELAEARHLSALYLLTTTAEGFFPRFGFERIARGDVPASVQASIEFTSACPSSATVMRKRL